MRITERIEFPVALIVLLGALAVSVAAFLLLGNRQIERVLFFPGNITSNVSGERRVVPFHHNVQEDMKQVVKEVILGPESIYNSRVLPKGSSIQLFMLRGDTLYIDFSSDIMEHKAEVKLNFDEGIATLEKTLRYNFRWLGKVIVTINGQLPFQPPYTPSAGQV